MCDTINSSIESLEVDVHCVVNPSSIRHKLGSDKEPTVHIEMVKEIKCLINEEECVMDELNTEVTRECEQYRHLIRVGLGPRNDVLLKECQGCGTQTADSVQ